jgi:HEAT repeat protein
MKSVALVAVLGLLAPGCEPPQPTLAGGKSVQHWFQALQSRDPRTRREAVYKLGNVGSADSQAVPAVLNALRDADAGVRREAILATIKFGAEARAALPELAEMQQHDQDSKVREYARKALESIGQEN